MTGTTSFLSSGAVIYFVLKSQSKLSSMYNRIMSFVSFWDMVASSAIALTTLPMPTDHIHPFGGKRLGNASTCEAQKFCVLLGGCFTVCENLALSIYYLCVIRYKIGEERIKKLVEPILFLLSVLTAMSGSVMCLIYGDLNPTLYYNLFSFWGPVTPAVQTLTDVMFLGILWAVGIIFISMIMIILTTYREEKEYISSHSISKNSVESGEENPCNNTTAESSWHSILRTLRPD